MIRRFGNQTLLMELVFAVIIFTFCAVICTGVFYQASFTANHSRGLSRAVFSAQTAAETFSATDNIEDMALLLGGTVLDGKCTVWFDGDWQACPPQSASGTMAVSLSREGAMLLADISVTGSYDVSYRLTAAKYAPEVER